MKKKLLKTKKLEVKKDGRGWLAELIRVEDVSNPLFGHLLVTVAKPGIIKGNHYHRRKREWYIVLKGKGLLKVWNKDGSEKKQMILDERDLKLVEIPTNYFHTIKNIGKEDLYLLSYLNESFNPEDPDTYYE